MSSLNIPLLDATAGDITSALGQLRDKLAPTGNIVSPRGRILTQQIFGEPLTPQQVVTRICDDVFRERQAAVLRYSNQLDGFTGGLVELRISEDQLRDSHGKCKPEFLACIRRITQRIKTFQTAILHQDVTTRPSPGVILQQRYSPLRRVGLCIPGGAAAYPSSLLMTAVPAQAAGVSEIAVVAPPSKLGAFNPDIQAICWELGITELYAVGGAQAVAALAYGIEGLPAVDKIVGPGNLFVALAKRHVFGHVDIDSIAGPSEVIVVADETTPPALAAADLLSQAEHSPGSSVLVSWNADMIKAIDAALKLQVAKLERGELILESLQEYGAYVLVKDQRAACDVIAQMAPEHLHIAIENARAMLPNLRNAGAIFLGIHTPVALGDYAAGPSHVLPTGGTARWASGLSSNHFLRSSSVLEFDQSALDSIAPDVIMLAEKEGLTAHRDSVFLRTNPIGAGQGGS